VNVQNSNNTYLEEKQHEVDEEGEHQGNDLEVVEIPCKETLKKNHENKKCINIIRLQEN
jgi:hypothetical protein